MAGNPLRRNQNLYCQYHQDQGHITEDCKNLWDHLDQLVREGKLKQLLHHFSGQVGQTGSDPRRDSSSRPPLRTINVIFATPSRTGSCLSRVMFVVWLPTEDSNSKPKRTRLEAPLILGFSANDKIGTSQPYDNALVVTFRIDGYDVKRVLVDQGSAVEIMYPDLYKGMNLKPKDLTAYDSPLVSFEGKTITPRGQVIAHTNRFQCGGSGLHHGGCLFTLYGYCGQALASYFRSRFFYPSPEGEVSIERSS